MKIYVLIVVCLYTLKGLSNFIKSVNNGNNNEFIASLLSIAIGIIAIVFQSINL